VCLDARQLPHRRGGLKCRRRLYELKMPSFQCGLWHRIRLAKEHRVHMRNSQTCHAPAVEQRLDFIDAH